MGGLGCGDPIWNPWPADYQRKPRVEDARALSVAEVVAVLRRKAILPKSPGEYRVSWLDATSASTTLTLRANPMPRGGVRWYLFCPNCGAHRTALYCATASGSTPAIACRVCIGLTYRSAQQAHRAKRDARKLAALLGGEVTLAQACAFVQTQEHEYEAVHQQF